jgi:ornithine--oxo-acid transaminase
MIRNAAELGPYFMGRLREIDTPHVKEIRGKGLLIGVELYKKAGSARRFCEALQREGLLCNGTHDNVIRLTPPLVVTKEELDWALARIRKILK